MSKARNRSTSAWSEWDTPKILGEFRGRSRRTWQRALLLGPWPSALPAIGGQLPVGAKGSVGWPQPTLPMLEPSSQNLVEAVEVVAMDWVQRALRDPPTLCGSTRD